MASDVPFLTDKTIDLPHGFFGRRGGVSTGIYDSLNCGTGSADNPAHVAENRSRIVNVVASRGAPLLTLSQIHSAKCLVVEKPFDPSEPRPQADAMVTVTPGLVLGVGGADCAPVLYSAKTRNGSPVIGAAHSGWAGAFKGVNESVINSLCLLGAVKDSICAAIGPCIGPDSYEVGPEIFEKFQQKDVSYEMFFSPSPKGNGHYMFNLPDFIEKRIRAAGVKSVSRDCVIDTYVAEDDYFSYRRGTHKNEDGYGRQLSVITLPKA